MQISNISSTAAIASALVLLLSACGGSPGERGWRRSRNGSTAGAVRSAPAPASAATRTEAPESAEHPELEPVAHLWLVGDEYLKIARTGVVEARSANLVPEADWVVRGAVTFSDGSSPEFFYAYEVEEHTYRYQFIPRPNDQLLVVNLNVSPEADATVTGASLMADQISEEDFELALANAVAARTPAEPSTETPAEVPAEVPPTE